MIIFSLSVLGTSASQHRRLENYIMHILFLAYILRTVTLAVSAAVVKGMLMWKIAFRATHLLTLNLFYLLGPLLLNH